MDVHDEDVQCSGVQFDRCRKLIAAIAGERRALGMRLEVLMTLVVRQYPSGVL